MPPMHSMLRTGRATIILTTIAVVAIILMTGLLLWQLRSEELRHAEGETISLSQIIVEQTNRSFQSVDLALEIALDRLAEAAKLKIALDEFAIHVMLRSRVEAMPQLRSMFILDTDGKVASSALSFPGPDLHLKDRDYFRIQVSHPNFGLFVSKPVTNRVDGKRTIFLSRRIQNSKGGFIGVVAASLDIAYIETLYDSAKFDSVDPIQLFLEDGTLVAGSPHDETRIAGKTILPALEKGGGERTRFKSVRSSGESAGVTTYRRISGYPLVLGVGNRDDKALEAWRETARVILTESSLAILLILAAAALLLREQRREEALAAAARESDERLRAMVASAMDAIVTIDNEGRFVAFNPAAQNMFGYSAEEVIGKPLDLLLPDRFRAAHGENVAAFGQSGVVARAKNSRMEIVGLHADGTEIPLETTITQMATSGRTLFTAILRDISERQRAESELHESNRQLRELASSLQAVRENERVEIARELHDELGQRLLRQRMDLDWIAGRLKDVAPALREKVAEMMHFTEASVGALRRVVTRLRPPLLDDLGLAEAAQFQLDEFAERNGIEVESHIAIDGVSLDDRTAINIFRMLQESLTNVARHSKATRVSVLLGKNEDSLLLEVSDNGCGTELRDKPTLGHGLVGNRERTSMLGGQMEIASAPGEGFTLRVTIPLLTPEPTGESK